MQWYFSNWLSIQEGSRSGAKLGLYPEIADFLGQHPPLYGMTKAADFITYLYLKFGKDGPPGKNGIIHYAPGKSVGEDKLPPV